ncbi:hypothetical protein [Propioniciclava soli]|uniref:Uncharacterized protein n=1 Tax=Propioniciclava soli TaxID=2775081 RepID=A0ABZ3C9P9_9ACTN|nr:hypothetical protein [Propioniciclava soli]
MSPLARARRGSTRLTHGLVAAGAFAALTLTGCAPSAANAAVVEGVRIPDVAVREATPVVAAILQRDAAVASRQAVFDLTVGEASAIIADRNEVDVTDAELSAVLSQSPRYAAAAQTEEGRDWVHSVARAFVVMDKVGREEFLAELGDMDIEINPRYGTWDGTRFTLADASLARVAPSAQVPG